MEAAGLSAVMRWQGLLGRVLLTLETSRLMLFRLARSEKKKSSLADRSKFVEQTSEALASCLHPETRRIRRGNQYANWTVCGVCGNRMTYVPKNPAAKSKVKARPKPRGGPSFPPHESQMVEQVLNEMEPSCDARASLPEVPSRGYASSSGRNPFTKENKNLSAFMQDMMSGMAQQNSQLSMMMGRLGNTMESMANNQSQMLMMMSQESPAASDVSMGMMNRLQEAAYRNVANAEEESASQWSLPDSMENPNRQGL